MRLEAKCSDASGCGDSDRVDLAPFLPTVKGAQIVGSHDPDEANARTVIAQVGDGLIRIAGADLRLEAEDLVFAPSAETASPAGPPPITMVS